MLQTFLRKNFVLCSFQADFASNRQTILNHERERNEICEHREGTQKHHLYRVLPLLEG